MNWTVNKIQKFIAAAFRCKLVTGWSELYVAISKFCSALYKGKKKHQLAIINCDSYGDPGLHDIHDGPGMHDSCVAMGDSSYSYIHGVSKKDVHFILLNGSVLQRI